MDNQVETIRLPLVFNCEAIGSVLVSAKTFLTSKKIDESKWIILLSFLVGKYFADTW